MKRLTAEQVANECLVLAGGLCDHEGPSNAHGLGYVEAMQDAAKLVRDNLVPRWQDEPDAVGWYWVEGYEGPRFIQSIHDVWMHGDDQFMAYEISLNNRRVCPIGERPEDGA